MNNFDNQSYFALSLDRRNRKPGLASSRGATPGLGAAFDSKSIQSGGLIIERRIKKGTERNANIEHLATK